MMNNIFASILLFLIGMVFGWIFAHSSVATECGKLNSFYVGDKVYNCEVKSK
jgi:hypothetical protein